MFRLLRVAGPALALSSVQGIQTTVAYAEAPDNIGTRDHFRSSEQHTTARKSHPMAFSISDDRGGTKVNPEVIKLMLKALEQLLEIVLRNQILKK